MLKKLIRYFVAKRIVSSKVEDLGSFLPNRFLYKIASQLTYDSEFPFQINLELSRACNYDCPFCARNETVEGNHINFDVAKKVVDEATDLKKTTIFALHMWGEPMLNPKWHAIVDYIKTRKIEHFASMTTNGYLLTKNNIDLLIKTKIDQIVISLHTFDEVEYKVRVGKEIELSLVEQRVKDLLKELKERSKKTNVIIRLFDSDEKLKDYKDKIAEYRKLGADFEFDYYDNSAGDRESWSEVKKEKRWPCYHPWLTTTVNIFGEATVCCVDSQMKLKIGDSQTSSIAKMWDSPLLNEMRQEHLSGKLDNHCSVCKGCDTWANKPNMFFSSQLRKEG